MNRLIRILAVCTIVAISLLALPSWVASEVGPGALALCSDVAFSTEEDFVTGGPLPSDGNPIISDGDLLSPSGAVCARNADLLHSSFDVTIDIGLDAADVIDVAEQAYLVAFSTELDSPNTGQFTAGDLLITNGAIIKNAALLAKWPVPYDIGLDAVHFVGDPVAIRSFLAGAKTASPVDAGDLSELFAAFEVDIWFSTEGTFTPPDGAAGFLDGDLLSAMKGTIIAGNDVLLSPAVPAGIPVPRCRLRARRGDDRSHGLDPGYPLLHRDPL